MAVWKEEDLKKIRRRLWYTADMTYVRGWFVALLVLEALFVGIMALKGGFDAFIWIFTTAAALVISMPILALCLWRTWQVYHHAEHYIFCRATLMSPHMNYLFRAMHFTVVVEDMDGNKFPANTSPIFHPYHHICHYILMLGRTCCSYTGRCTDVLSSYCHNHASARRFRTSYCSTVCP